MSAMYEEDSNYIRIMDLYKHDGFSMLWEMKSGEFIKIEDMKDSHVQNCINMMRRNPLTETRRGWIDVFTDVQVKRRRLKIEKIKEKM